MAVSIEPRIMGGMYWPQTVMATPETTVNREAPKTSGRLLIPDLAADTPRVA